MNPVRQHPLVTLGIIVFFAVTALVVFRLSSGAKIDQKKSRVITVGTVTPLKQDLEIRLGYTADITPSDGAHLTIAGLRKQAALEWRVLALQH